MNTCLTCDDQFKYYHGRTSVDGFPAGTLNAVVDGVKHSRNPRYCTLACAEKARKGPKKCRRCDSQYIFVGPGSKKIGGFDAVVGGTRFCRSTSYCSQACLDNALKSREQGVRIQRKKDRSEEIKEHRDRVAEKDGVLQCAYCSADFVCVPHQYVEHVPSSKEVRVSSSSFACSPGCAKAHSSREGRAYRRAPAYKGPFSRAGKAAQGEIRAKRNFELQQE